MDRGSSVFNALQYSFEKIKIKIGSSKTAVQVLIREKIATTWSISLGQYLSPHSTVHQYIWQQTSKYNQSQIYPKEHIFTNTTS